MKLPALCLLGVAVFGLVVLLVSGPRDPSPESVDPLANMVWIEGGEFIQGSENEALRGAQVEEDGDDLPDDGQARRSVLLNERTSSENRVVLPA